jgi:hypothetical protein
LSGELGQSGAGARFVRPFVVRIEVEVHAVDALSFAPASKS